MPRPDEIERGTRLQHRAGSPHEGPITVMAKADGYVMVRRPGCAPFVLSVREAASLPLAPPAKRGAR